MDPQKKLNSTKLNSRLQQGNEQVNKQISTDQTRKKEKEVHINWKINVA